MGLELNQQFILTPFPQKVSLDTIVFDIDNQQTAAQLEEPMNQINRVVADKLAGLGHPPATNPLHLPPSDVRTLREHITQNQHWRGAATAIIMNNASNSLEIDIDAMLAAITRPWFNEQLVSYGGYALNSQALHITSSVRHSYFTHFTDQLIPTGQHHSPLSVAGVVHLENLLVLGWRGGHNFADTVHIVPAGSITYRTQFFDKEVREELGDIPSSQYQQKPAVVGMVTDTKGKGWQYLVVHVDLNMSAHDFMQTWIHAEEREHRFLPLLPDSLEAFLHYAAHNRYDIGKEDPSNRAMTTEDNRGKILPQAVAIVLLDYATRLPRNQFVSALQATPFSSGYTLEETVRP
ncbi:hypothetical protein HY491_01500 [Candidatus Woesearchaeota archaeon]|nr:hypothetical protein [Candidatus Woesearchaeota archaeon]